jgi:hypothetical protein
MIMRSIKVLPVFVLFVFFTHCAGLSASEKKYKLLKPPEGFQISKSEKEIIETRALLPEGNTGIAAKYPGDAGIENDPNVIFVEKFDAGPGQDLLSPIAKKMIVKRWDTVKHEKNMKLSNEVPAGSADKRSLLFERGQNQGGGGYLYRKIEPEVEKVFVRYYVKFNEQCGKISHFGAWIGGYNPPTAWPQGGAGSRPSGSKRFTTGVEPGGGWGWDFYTYWQGMHKHGDGRYWGTPFLVKGPKPKVDKGQWICVETMVKLNDPVSASNGEQAFWIDGRLFRRGGQVASHFGPGFPKGKWMGGWWSADSSVDKTFDGMQWRSSKELAINFLWLQVYKLRAPKQGTTSRVWLDNVVVAKSYIGPMESR